MAAQEGRTKAMALPCLIPMSYENSKGMWVHRANFHGQMEVQSRWPVKHQSWIEDTSHTGNNLTVLATYTSKLSLDQCELNGGEEKAPI